jgi:uncharacterized protein YndB with AHSA1/START domain
MTEHLAGRRIEREVVIAAPPEVVFRALIDPALMSRWYAGDVRIEARPGGAVRFDWGDDGVVTGAVVAVDPPHRLVLDWREPPGASRPAGATTRIVFELAPAGAGTRLRLVHSGFGGGDDWDRLYDGEATGWGDLLEALRFLVEGNGAQPSVVSAAGSGGSSDSSR